MTHYPDGDVNTTPEAINAYIHSHDQRLIEMINNEPPSESFMEFVKNKGFISCEKVKKEIQEDNRGREAMRLVWNQAFEELIKKRIYKLK